MKAMAAGRKDSLTTARRMATAAIAAWDFANGNASSVTPERNSDARISGTAPIRSTSLPAAGAATIAPNPYRKSTKPAFSAENPRSRVRYRTRKDRTMEPARLTSCEAETVHTGFGRCRRSFQYFSMGSEVCTGSAGPEFSDMSHQGRREIREEGEHSQESEDVEKNREKS